jgi:predicted nucleotidyltransferase
LNYKANYSYGSIEKGTAGKGSDVAVVVSKTADIKAVVDVFISIIMPKFKSYFGVQLDSYIKSSSEFRGRLKKNLPPVSTLMKSYTTLYGKEPLEV